MTFEKARQARRSSQPESAARMSPPRACPSGSSRPARSSRGRIPPSPWRLPPPRAGAGSPHRGLLARAWRCVRGLHNLRAGFAGPLLMGVAVLALAALAAPPARAQTVVTLVSNTGGVGASSSLIVAQSFTTGSYARGYEISEVQIYIFSVPNAADRPTDWVKIYADNDSGLPGALVATLTNPSTFATSNQSNTFTAPSGTRLNRNTTYWLVVNDGVSDATNIGHWSSTDRNNETGEDGWSIGNGSLHKSLPAHSWATGNNSLVFAVRGPAPPPLDATDATLSELILTNADNNEIALSPAFSSATTSYIATADPTGRIVVVTFRTANPNAAVLAFGSVERVEIAGTFFSDPLEAPIILQSLGGGQRRFSYLGTDPGIVTNLSVVVTSQDRDHVQRYRVRLVIGDVPPTLVSAVVAPRGASPTADTVYLRYDRALRPDGPDPGNPLAPPAEAFSVAVDGTPVTVTSAQINGNTVALRLAESFGHRVRRATVSYTPPSVNPVQTTRAGLARALTDHPLEIRIPPSGPGTGGATGKELLDAVMTLGYDALNMWTGYTDGLGGTDPIGLLSPTDFHFGGADYKVGVLRIDENASLRLSLHGGLTEAAAARLALYVGGTRFRGEDARINIGGTTNVSFIWANSGLTWQVGDVVPVLIVDANKPPVFIERGGTTERYLYENPPTPFGRFGAVHRMVPVKATDPDGDALRYALEGRDAHLFTIDEAAGWIMTRADTIYDYETEERTCHYNGNPEFRPCYAMRVRVTDSYGASATKGLSILLDNDVDRVVQNLRVVALAGKSDELRVSWNPVSPDERPESYWVEWYTADEGESWRWYRKAIEGDQSGTWLRSLEADTRYRVRVRPIYPDDHDLAYWSRTVVGGTGAASGPVPVSAAVGSDGTAIVLRFDEAISATVGASSAFRVIAGEAEAGIYAVHLLMPSAARETGH